MIQKLSYVLCVPAIVLFLVPGCSFGLLSRKPAVDPQSKEGQFFSLFDLEDDSGKRLELINQFATMFPKHPAAIWSLEQILESHRQAAAQDKIIQTAEKLLALTSDHIDAAYYAWKAAETKGDKAATAKWFQMLNLMAPRVIASAQPANPDDLGDWQASVNLAKQFVAVKDGGMYSKALEAKDPAKRIAILDELVKSGDDSAQRVDVDLLYVLAYRQIGSTGKAVEAGLRVLETSKVHEDIILFIADYYFQRRESARAIAFCQRLIEVMRTKQRPSNIGNADWERQKATCNGSAYYMIGFLQMEAGQYLSADSHFRGALAYLGNGELAAIVLNSLGYVNLRLDKYGDALKFYKRCMDIKGPYQLQAAQYVDTILLQHPDAARQQ